MEEGRREASSGRNAGLNEVHRFGRASESLFRRLYRRLNRRQQLEFEVRHQGERLERKTADYDSLQRNYTRLQSAHSRRVTELERLYALLNSLEEGIIVQEANGKVTMMNAAAEAMLGGKRAFWDSALGTLFEQYRDVQETSAELTPLGESGEIPLNNRIVRAQLIAIGDDDRRRIGAVVILRDVTYDALAARLKDGFVSRIAGEMEKPISVMRLATELLSGQPEDRDVNQRLLEKLLQNVDMLDQLALELLDIAQIDSGAFAVTRAPVPVERVVWSVVNGISADVKSRGVDLLVMTRELSGVRVRGDESRLQWALGHLIRNGADYNRERGYVAVAARVDRRNEELYALVSVSDNGIGIHSADLPHIFERFYRGQRSGPETGPRGLGQGLYVARAICQAHGGFVEAQSRQNIGSIFTLGLPLHVEGAATR